MTRLQKWRTGKWLLGVTDGGGQGGGLRGEGTVPDPGGGGGSACVTGWAGAVHAAPTSTPGFESLL